ncbi:MAG: glycosyltransferase [Phycisphaerales bacterium]
MRILHVIEGLNPDRGGPPQVAAALAAAEVRLGHTITAASHDATGAPARGLLTQHEPTGQIATLDVPFGGFFGWRRVVAALDRADRPEAVHLHGVWNPITLHGSRFARLRRLPYVITTHGSMHPVPFGDRSAKRHLALRLGYGRMFRDARRVFVLNDEEAESLARHVPGSRPEVLPNGIDPQRIPTPDAAAFRSAHPELGDRPYLVFVGRLDRTKGVDHLVEAHQRVLASGHDVDLVVIGNDWGAEATVRRVVADLNVGHRVHLVGAVHGDAKYHALAGARAFVHLPRYEGFGLAVIEALAVGTPAVMGDRCRLPGANEAMGILVSPSDPASFAERAARILADAALRDRLGAAGKDAALSRYTWDAIARRVVAPLESR